MMAPHTLGLKATLAVTASMALTALAQIATDAGHVNLAELAASIAVGCSVFLFTLFIRQQGRIAALEATNAANQRTLDRVDAHGAQIAELRTYAERNKADIDKLDAESRTVDKRIEMSRHTLRNEVQQVTANIKEDIMVRVDETMRATAKLEERLNGYLEDQAHGPKRRDR